jgi:hypothetical protein
MDLLIINTLLTIRRSLGGYEREARENRRGL